MACGRAVVEEALYAVGERVPVVLKPDGQVAPGSRDVRHDHVGEFFNVGYYRAGFDVVENVGCTGDRGRGRVDQLAWQFGENAHDVLEHADDLLRQVFDDGRDHPVFEIVDKLLGGSGVGFQFMDYVARDFIEIADDFMRPEQALYDPSDNYVSKPNKLESEGCLTYINLLDAVGAGYPSILPHRGCEKSIFLQQAKACISKVSAMLGYEPLRSN